MYIAIVYFQEISSVLLHTIQVIKQLLIMIYIELMIIDCHHINCNY